MKLNCYNQQLFMLKFSNQILLSKNKQEKFYLLAIVILFVYVAKQISKPIEYSTN